VLGVAGYGVRVGAQADLVVVNASSPAEAVVARPPRRYVFKAGKLVARDGVFVRH
jgi:cytosine deaminase